MSAADGVDVAAERARTPGATTGHHFNAAGAALPAASTVATVVAHLELETAIGGYEAAWQAAPRLEGVYRLAASAIGAHEDEIALVESATAGWQRAVAALRLRPGDRVLAARSSYVSSALQLLALERETGIAVELLDLAPDGGVDLDSLDRSLRRGPVALVTAAHVPTSSGLVEPVEQIGAACRAAGVPFLLDATQSVGQLDVDVRRIGCDLLVSTGRKFLRGPRGTGLLYASAGITDRLAPVSPDVRGARWIRERDWTVAPGARRFELWEAAHALRLGLGAALADFAALGGATVAHRIASLGSRIRAELSEVDGVRVVDPAAAGGGIVTFEVPGIPAERVQAELSARGVHLVSVPASHGRWDLGARELPAVLRASAHVYNDDTDVYALVEAVREVARDRPKQARVVAPAEPDPFSRLVPGGGRPVPEVFDAVVVGLGVHGRATLHELARRGLRVAGLERFRLGHERGSSHGATRMIRRAYPNPVWDPLVEDAYEAWTRLERDSGVSLVRTTGGLYARPPAGPAALRGPGCTEVDAGEAAKLMPALRLAEGWSAVYDPAAGVLDAEAAMRVQLDLATAAGAEVREREPVLQWQYEGDLIAVHTPRERLLTRNLVVCAGPWLGSLLPEFAGELRPTRIVNAYFPGAAPEAFGPPRLGAFSAELPEGLAYGIPALDGRGVKLGLDSGPAIDPDDPAGPATAAELGLLTSIAARLLPGAGAVGEHLTCRYTMTGDRRFLVGPVPERPGVFVASACSGHGFKFAPALGAALADLITGRDRDDLAFLSPARLPVKGVA
ncbi:N-methyl-L-tryptophan oxidase [Amycolatopsis acididurans]|uniref:N-methyl-L-tryptophan oxidase n=1 Tax=Amycolatopsis acididurans TaxID=2724524 RepID=UPI001B320E47|nr:N-methyl-L-tryptophan oxidase [Amycolatopsis acididurans]